MADYYSILKKTISGLPSDTSENRKLVYGKARQAIDRQLRSIDPPLADDAIARQLRMLEQAIERIEAEHGVIAPPAHGEVPAGMATPERQSPPAHGRPVVTPAPQVRASDERFPAPDERPLPGTAPAPRREPAAPEIRTRVEERHPGARPLPGSTDLPIPGIDDDASGPAYDRSFDALGGADDMMAPEAPPVLERKRSRGLARVLMTLIVLALVGAGGYALWLNQEPLMAALGLNGDKAGTQVATETTQPAAPAAQPEQPADTSGAPADPADADSGKEDVRLSQSGETVPGPEPVREAGQPAVEPAQPAAPAADAAPEAVSEESQGPATQVSPVEEPGAADAETATGEEDAPATASELPAVAQKAYLYEEGSTGAGATRDNAAIVWSLDEQTPAEGAPPEAVIRGSFDVPGRGLTMQISIRRNTDDALPASHIIELNFETPTDFSGGNVDTVARFVMKSSEQARGEGLIAVPAKIDDGMFLIALNNLAQAIETNRKLLVDSTWIDIPVGYTSGKRALVTLEKGAVGDKVFRDAFADWDSR